MLGRNIFGPALLYEKSSAAARKTNFHVGGGVGYIWDHDSRIPTLPLFLGAHTGRTHNKFEYGIAGFVPLKDYINVQVNEGLGTYTKDYIIPVTLYFGFKHYPKNNNGLFYHVNLQPLFTHQIMLPVLPSVGVGIGYSFSKTKE
ncbi:hypothetical protein [Adhaeribacter aquaticus]|uniref:hypothetical protein n=1 Tax=Adhaeribacter aquaticus TaxID=299567 RepID=UPI0003FB8DE6|nr:hypothetical protein [Adhaeribacter aquaticus]